MPAIPATGQPATDGLLSAKHVMEYPYRRSLGPVLSRFFTGLRDRRIEGVRSGSGRVLVPPLEYDPESGDATGEFVEVPRWFGSRRAGRWALAPRPGRAWA